MTVEKYHTCRLGGKRTREKNFHPTTDQQAAINQKHAERHLAEVMGANFRRDDLYITLTHADPEPGYEEAARRIKTFLRKLRDLYRKRGLVLRYIYTTEGEEEGRLHHHLLISGGLTRGDVQALWPWGRIRHYAFQPFDGSYKDCQRLAAYFCKERRGPVRRNQQKKRWIGSRNLRKPTVYYATIQSRHWRENPGPPKGYEAVEVINTFTNDGYPYQLAIYRKRGRDPAAQAFARAQ